MDKKAVAAIVTILCLLANYKTTNSLSAEQMQYYVRYHNYLRRIQESDERQRLNYYRAAAAGHPVAMDTGQAATQEDADLEESPCRSLHYKKMTRSMQHEHQCLQLETIQKNIDVEKDDLQLTYKRIMRGLSDMGSKIEQVTGLIAVSEALESLDVSDFMQPKEVPVVRDCYTLGKTGFRDSGTYPLYTMEGKITLASCDLETDGGGWTVMQRRLSDRVNFTRTWNEYRRGFGNPNGDYWLGNEMIHQLTKFKKHTLRIDMWDWAGKRAYAAYENFSVGAEKTKYRIWYGDYHGNAGDSFKRYHNNTPFSTPDQDNDYWHASCAGKERAGWWYRDCSYAALNGPYHRNGKITIGPSGLEGGVLWYEWKSDYTYSLKKVEMKIRPMVGY